MIPIAHPILGSEEIEAVLLVLTSGQLAPGERVAAFERRFSDVCHIREAVARIDEKSVGSFGTGCFSFYATKNITTGEGGMVLTNDPKIGLMLCSCTCLSPVIFGNISSIKQKTDEHKIVQTHSLFIR